RKEARLLEDEAGYAGEIFERRLAAEGGELIARGAVPELGLVAEGEERLGAARGGARARDREHLVLGQVGALAAARRPGEGAVVADVAAELRQRDEDLRRVGDDGAGAGRAHAARLGAELPDGRVDEGVRLLPQHAEERTRWTGGRVGANVTRSAQVVTDT